MELAFFIIIIIAVVLGISCSALMVIKANSEWYEKICVAILTATSITLISFLYKTGLYKVLWHAWVKGVQFSIALLIFCIPLFIADAIDESTESSF